MGGVSGGSAKSQSLSFFSPPSYCEYEIPQDTFFLYLCYINSFVCLKTFIQLVILQVSPFTKFLCSKYQKQGVGSICFRVSFLNVLVEGKGCRKKKPSIFTDIVQIGGREFNPISKNLKEMIF